MYLALNLAREVKVYIRRFVSVESEERLKRYVVTVAPQLLSAYRTYRIGKVKPRTDMIGIRKIAVPAFRAVIVRRQGIDLRYSRHRSNERRPDRPSRADQIPLTLAEPHQLLRDHVKHRKAVLDYGGQLLVKPRTDYLRYGLSVLFLGIFVADPLKILLRPVHVRVNVPLGKGRMSASIMSAIRLVFVITTSFALSSPR